MDEVAVMLARHDAKLDYMTMKLDRIELQTTVTNGRVNKLEEWKAVKESGLTLVSKGFWIVGAALVGAIIKGMFG